MTIKSPRPKNQYMYMHEKIMEGEILERGKALVAKSVAAINNRVRKFLKSGAVTPTILLLMSLNQFKWMVDQNRSFAVLGELLKELLVLLEKIAILLAQILEKVG